MPGPLYSLGVHLLRQITVVDAPKQAITEESRARSLEAGSMFWVHHRSRPMPLRLLQTPDGPS